MTQPPPLPIGSGRAVLRFFIALLIGTAISAITWIAGWQTFDRGGDGYLILLIPGIKLATAIPLLIQRRWRAAGAGLLTSVPIGALIFFGSCASHMNMH